MTHLLLYTEKLFLLGLAKLFYNNIWKLHGLPDSITSDREVQFASQFTKELNKMLGIETKLSTAFHSQTDGQTERINQEVEQYLRLFINHRQNDWSDWIPSAEFSLNNATFSVIKNSPFFSSFEYNPRMGTEPFKNFKNPLAKDFIKTLK